jgi:glycosyltransferase involved in cell wall biosynthesis
MRLRIVFHISNFTVRGSESAAFDYAYYNVHLLHNESLIVAPTVRQQPTDENILRKFQEAFGKIYFYKSHEDLEQWCLEQKADTIYVIKYGKKDRFLWKIPTLVHAVFFMKEPHGLVYAGVSDSVARTDPPHIHPVVPHIITLPDETKNFRKQLQIPEEALIFGRHGGADTFDLLLAGQAIIEVVQKRADIYFLFAVRPTLLKSVNHPQIKFIDAFADPRIKRRFINTCDGMVHGCELGESFGISVLEFSYCNKPVITWSGGTWHKQHLVNLGNKAVIYNSREELVNILLNFRKEDYAHKDWNVTAPFTPEKVMAQFDKVFLEPVRELSKSNN